MKYYSPNNTTNTNVTYHREHTGPNFFRVYYKQGCYIRYTPKEVGRVFGIAKFTNSVNELRDWCYQMIDKFGPEHHDDPDYIKWKSTHGTDSTGTSVATEGPTVEEVVSSV